MTGAPHRSLNLAVEQASAILASDPAAARSEAEAILNQRPGDPRALLILASASRRQGDAATALTMLEPLAQAFPHAAHTRYELGQALAALSRTAEALDVLRDAVRLKPDLAEAWRALGELLFAEGDNQGAEAAFAAHDRAMVHDPVLAPTANALYGGRLEEAEQRLRTIIAARPNDVATLRLFAETLGRLGRYAASETVLTHALALDPTHEGARFAYAYALFRQQKSQEALGALGQLLVKYPSQPVYRNLEAACLTLLGKLDAVIAINERLAADYPRQPKIWLNYGHALRTVGRRSNAISAYRQAIALRPSYGEAWWALADLKVERLSNAEAAALNVQLSRVDLGEQDRVYLEYATGKVLEDSGDAFAAFAHYARGAELHRRTSSYDPEALATLTAQLKALFTPAFLSARRGWGAAAGDPIFIVGLPRSGSTLIEQILASHSAVEGVMELADIGILASELGWPGSDYAAALATLDADGAAQLGERYLERTRVHRPLGLPHFIDKMPHNFQHLGLIHMILPNARIIDARRHPLASGFSAFKQRFNQGQEFSYDLTHIGRYYKDYVHFMAHLDAVLPRRIHRVIYEDVIDNTEREIKRLLDYCGLPFEAGCLAFHENSRPVRTVSSEQVRRPIFRDGMHQWHKYQPWLGALEAALGEVLQTWRGEPNVSQS